MLKSQDFYCKSIRNCLSAYLQFLFTWLFLIYSLDSVLIIFTFFFYIIFAFLFNWWNDWSDELNFLLLIYRIFSYLILARISYAILLNQNTDSPKNISEKYEEKKYIKTWIFFLMYFESPVVKQGFECFVVKKSAAPNVQYYKNTLIAGVDQYQ